MPLDLIEADRPVSCDSRPLCIGDAGICRSSAFAQLPTMFATFIQRSMANTLEPIRYRTALCVSSALALLAVSGLGMGGPHDAIGWVNFLLLLFFPMAIWLSRHGAAAPYLQVLSLAIAAVAVGYVAFVAFAE